MHKPSARRVGCRRGGARPAATGVCWRRGTGEASRRPYGDFKSLRGEFVFESADNAPIPRKSRLAWLVEAFDAVGGEGFYSGAVEDFYCCELAY